MNTVAKAKPGMEFCLTDKGAQIGRIKVKFAGETAYHKGFRKAVPQAWLDNGWVEERKISDGN